MEGRSGLKFKCLCTEYFIAHRLMSKSYAELQVKLPMLLYCRESLKIFLGKHLHYSFFTSSKLKNWDTSQVAFGKLTQAVISIGLACGYLVTSCFVWSKLYWIWPTSRSVSLTGGTKQNYPSNIHFKEIFHSFHYKLFDDVWKHKYRHVQSVSDQCQWTGNKGIFPKQWRCIQYE